MAEFVSPRGGTLSDNGDDGHVVWARFERAPDLDTADGEMRYRCVTTDAAAVKRLRALAKDPASGIEEVKATRERDNDNG